jgi:hypothetical protein
VTASALRHFVERAADRHGPSFADWFPRSFDWEALCSDAPAMAASLGRAAASVSEDRRLEAAAEAAFRAAYLAGLAVLSAAAEGEDDPDGLLARLASAPDDEEEAEFARLAEDCVGDVEEVLGGEDGPAREEEAAEALHLAEVAWPAVEAILGEAVAEAAGDDEEAGVLFGLARVGVILAGIRWMTVAASEERWPAVPGADDEDVG